MSEISKDHKFRDTTKVPNFISLPNCSACGHNRGVKEMKNGWFGCSCGSMWIDHSYAKSKAEVRHAQNVASHARLTSGKCTIPLAITHLTPSRNEDAFMRNAIGSTTAEFPKRKTSLKKTSLMVKSSRSSYVLNAVNESCTSIPIQEKIDPIMQVAYTNVWHVIQRLTRKQ